MNTKAIIEHVLKWVVVAILAGVVQTYLDVRDLKRDVRAMQQYMAHETRGLVHD